MPNKNYIKGVRKERKIVNENRDKGLIALRSAGSHSPIDVIVIDRDNKIIMLYQCKPDDYSQRKIDDIIDTLHLNGTYELKFEVI